MRHFYTNYHCHSNFCDGKGKLEEFVLQAISCGFYTIGFSSHMPLPFENKWSMREVDFETYLSEIERLQGEYQERIEIYKGLEFDYLPGFENVNRLKSYQKKLDYAVYSLHFLKSNSTGKLCEIDGPTEVFLKVLHDHFEGNILLLQETYFREMLNMIEECKPVMVGHIDKLKIHNYHSQLIDETNAVFQKGMDTALEAIKANKCFLEINTRGLYKKKTSDLYPSVGFIKKALAMQIPLVLNSDSHVPSEINGCFSHSFGLLKSLGTKELMVLKDAAWIPMPIDEYGYIE